MANAEPNPNDLELIYSWVDLVQLSRPKRNIARDFSDGVLMAEVVKHHCGKLVDLHNYSPSNKTDSKQYNWLTLNQKVFKKMGFTLPQSEIDAVVNCERGAIERVLILVKASIEKYLKRGSHGGKSGSAADLPADEEQEDVSNSPQLPPLARYQGQQQQLQSPPSQPPAQQQQQQPARQPSGAPRQQSGQGQAAGLEEASQEQLIRELRDMASAMILRIDRLEGLLRSKDRQIAQLTAHSAQQPHKPVKSAAH